MTPAAIIKDAAADGVTLVLTPVGTIKAAGDAGSVARWLPIIRAHKPGLVAVLAAAANDATAYQVGGDRDPLLNAAEARRQRVLAMLAERPGVRYSLVTDTEADSEAVILALAIRGVGTCELRIPKSKYDPFLLLDLIERHGGTVH